jgi:hypothetical protein
MQYGNTNVNYVILNQHYFKFNLDMFCCCVISCKLKSMLPVFLLMLFCGLKSYTLWRDIYETKTIDTAIYTYSYR